jgi:cell division protein FtsI/penicillin-binding protein 2
VGQGEQCTLGGGRYRYLGRVLVVGAVLMAGLVQARGSSATPPSIAPTSTGFTSSIEPRVQQAAIDAVGGATLPVDLVAIRASTGQVLAYVSRGAGLRSDDALVGKYPPGSTFKIVTAADLLAHGLTPRSPATCPASLLVGGSQLTNFGALADPTVKTLAQAFAHSCNTAFNALGLTLSAKSYATTAKQLGLGVVTHLGRTAFGGTVGTARSDSERAVLAADGGATLVSPLAMATVAASVDAGSFHPARLNAGAASTGNQPLRLDRRVIAGLRSMMDDAVTNGTATGVSLPAGTHAKTGTAEFADASMPRTVYAWLVGYRGDVAFAVMVVGGTQGGPAAGPIAAKFLTAIG